MASSLQLLLVSLLLASCISIAVSQISGDGHDQEAAVSEDPTVLGEFDASGFDQEAPIINEPIVMDAFGLDFVGASDATAFCFQCRSRRNQKDLYADPTECHHYFQCFYMNDTFAVGIRRECAAGTFWHDAILQCMPELPGSPCVDPCLNDAVSTRGQYAGAGCRQFFVCANTASYAMCCPLGTFYNANNFDCEPSTTCTDDCSQSISTATTTVKPSSRFNSTVCRDSWGTYISTVPGTPNAYFLIDSLGQPATSTPQFCIAGFAFNLVTCRCDIESLATVPPVHGLRRATLWIPFDADWKDHSIYKWSTFLYDGASRDTTAFAIGGGSLATNGGRVEIPGLKTLDLQGAASWCAFFRCETGPASNPYLCNSRGGILSNNKDASSSEFTIVMATSGSNSFTAKVDFWHPAGTQTVQSSSISTPTNGWNHVCVVYTGNVVGLYLNGALADSQSIGGWLSLAHCPYVIGNDQFFGEFNGHIDDVLVTPFAMTQLERDAHRNGNRAYLQSQGFFL